MKNQTNSVKTPFSTSELRAVELLAQGYTEKEIAEKLCISAYSEQSPKKCKGKE
jgi:DNA-binding NarL/FixJ family response regulator